MNKNTDYRFEILFLAIVLIGSISCMYITKSYYHTKYSTESDTNDYMTFTAKVLRTEVVNDKFYIVDYDKHVFELEFNPELLLLEKDSLVEMIFKTEYQDDNVILVDSYNMYGALIYYADYY